MTIVAQVVTACVVGFITWLIAYVLGAPDPWPIVIGVIAALACLGISVIIVDEDMF